MRRCEYCGKSLPANAAPRKRFCSAECERRSYYEGRRDRDHAREEVGDPYFRHYTESPMLVLEHEHGASADSISITTGKKEK